MQPSRFVFGPKFDFADVAAPDPGNGKADVAVSFVEVDVPGRVVVVDVPAYDLAQTNRLVELRAYLLLPGAEPGTDATAFVAGQLPYGSIDVTDLLDGARVRVPIPTAEKGQYIGQLVLGFEK